MDATGAFVRWLEAVNQTPASASPDRGARLRAAVAPEVRVLRHMPAARGAAPGVVVETFAGIDRVHGWLERTPAAIVFSLVGAPWREPDPEAGSDRWGMEYALTVEDFANGGLWIARLDERGLIVELGHRPFPLPEKGS